ncbi:MAG: UDP-3-O-(3-hydroxymyristoyl)glucosamine N-acyltransferase [Bdellovibrionaceae bacterium]|nr:UDP-3-O-(3-hydroxymyristoyl)glucosamine N-acyltransferase [Pseudobdellovibrionaceae bacterium]
MPSVSCLELQQQFKDQITSSLGSFTGDVDNVSSLENIRANSIVYLTQEKGMDKVLHSSALLVIAHEKCKSLVPTASHLSWIFCKNPELLMANIKKTYFLATPYRAPHMSLRAPSAIIHESALVAESAVIGPGAFIGEKVYVGQNSFVGANSIIEENAKIGDNTTIHPLVYIGHSCEIGDNCEILPHTCIGSEGYGYAHDERWNHYRIPHSGKVILKNDVHVGANCSIDRGSIEDTVIGQGTKIDNQCHLAHNSIIGKNGLITAQFGMAGSSTIGDNFVSGGKASVTGHITITNNVQISGMSGVTKSITEPGQYGGFPLQKLQDYLKTKAALAKLPELREQLRNLLKKN